MDIDKEILDFHYHNILNGFSSFLFDGKAYLGKHVCSNELFQTNAHILESRDSMKKGGVATEYDIINDCISKGLWDRNKDIDIKNFENKIKKAEDLLPKLTLPSQAKKAEVEIKDMYKELDVKQNERFALISQSLEQQLLMEKRDYLAFLCVYKNKETRLWDTYYDFLSESNSFTLGMISSYYSTINSINASILRCIARTTDARYRLKNTSKTPEGTSTIYLELSQWCDFYTSIFELEDRPDDSIIKDDKKLDAWLMARKLKNKAEKSVNTKEGFTGIVGGTKEDMEALEGTNRNTLINLAKK